MKVCIEIRFEAAFKTADKSMLLKLSVRSAGREFQIVGAAWPYVSHMFYKKRANSVNT